MATEFISNSWLMPTNANAEANRVSNYSLDFDGSSEKITLSTAINTGNNYSVSFWLNPDNVASGNSYIFSDSTTSPFKGLALDQGSYTAGGPGNFYYYSGSVVVPNTTAIPLGSWSHIVITFDVTGQEIKFYINGSLDKTTTSVANIGTLIDEFGTRIAGNYFNGKLTEISIFDYIVSASQVLELYGTGSAIGNPMSLTTKPVAYYPLGNAPFNGEFLATNNATELYENYSLSFDSASSDYINCGASSFSGETGVSVSAWVYPTSVGTAQAEAIISTDVASTAPRGFYLALYASNKIRWQIGTTVYNSKNSLDVTNTLQLNQWNHLVGTWNATTMSVYINGSLAGDEPSGVANGTFNSTNNILIGARETTGGYFPGRISNAAIFKSTLSAAQVTTLYNSGKPFDLNTFAVTPVSWWRLGASGSSFDGTNWTILDEIGTNNGTSANMTQADLVDGIGATGNGVSSGMSSGTNRSDAPYSSNNAVSYNMSVTAKSTSVPT